jgi:hypothetical protein
MSYKGSTWKNKKQWKRISIQVEKQAYEMFRDKHKNESDNSVLKNFIYRDVGYGQEYK